MLSSPTAFFRLTQSFGGFSARYRLLISLGLAAAGWLLAPASLAGISRWVVAWDVFAASTLVLIGAAMFTADTASIRKVANTEDPSRALALVFVLVAALASLLAVVALLGALPTPSTATAPLPLHIGLSMAAVVEAWLLVHTVFTLRYAHIYYDADDENGSDTGGLVFPRQRRPGTPNYLDFAYFAFTIGMAAQTADVTIRQPRQRRTPCCTASSPSASTPPLWPSASAPWAAC